MTYVGTREAEATSSPTAARLPGLGLRLLLAMVAADLVESWRNPLVKRGMVAMALIGAGAMTPAFLPTLPDNGTPAIVETLHLGFLQDGAGRFAATIVLSAGVVLLLDTWLRLRPVGSGRTAPASTWVWWSLPVLLAPPLFSRDAYSYAAQGLVVARGMNPYEAGPITVPGPFADNADNLWTWASAPYGPLALQIQHLIVWLTGGTGANPINAYGAAVAMRLPALVAMGIIAYALPRLAEQVGVSRQQAIWLGVLNPLAVLHIIGGMHNDAMMIALVVAGLLLASHHHLVWGSIAVAAGASVKQTAVLALIGVVGLALRRAEAQVPLKDFLIGCVKSGAVALAAFQTITVATGLGWGWVPNMAVPGSIRSLLSPPTLIGSIPEGIMYLAGVPQEVRTIPVAVMQALGMVCFVLIAGWLLVRVAPRRPAYAAGLAFVCFCLCGPVIHPWYMLWGGVILAACPLGGRMYRAMVYVSLFLCTYSLVDASLGNGASALVFSTLALVLWGMQGVFRRGRPTSASLEGEATGLIGPRPWGAASPSAGSPEVSSAGTATSRPQGAPGLA